MPVGCPDRDPQAATLYERPRGRDPTHVSVYRNAIDNHSHLALNLCMYVCICNAVTDKQIRTAAESGVQDLWGLQRELGVAAGCGACKEMASEILRKSRQTKAQFEPVRYLPATG